MKKQSDPQEFNDVSIDSDQNADSEEVTVKKHSPLTPEEEALAESELEEDYKSLYEATLDELKAAKEESLRKLAEMENFRKRLLKEKEDFNKFANEGLLQDLLPCIDNLEMTLQHASPEQLQKDPVISGLGLVLKQFLKTLEKHGLEEVKCENLAFDPNFHEAIGSQPAEGVASNQILVVHRKGYILAGRLLRAAMVTVSA